MVDFLTPIALLLLPIGWGLTLLLSRKTGRVGRVKGLPLGLRLAAVTLLGLTVAGMSVSAKSNRKAVAFIADLSASAASENQNIAKFISDAIANTSEQQQSGIIAFAADSVIEYSPQSRTGFAGFSQRPNARATNIARALELGAAMLPDGAQRRLVLISDGRENAGDAIATADRLGLPVDVVMLSPSEATDAQVSDVWAPTSLHQGEAFDVRVRVDSTDAMNATLRLYMNGVAALSRDVTLRPGVNTFVFSVVAENTGIQALDVVLEAQGDTLWQNDRRSAHTSVLGVPRVLVAEGLPGEGAEIVRQLEALGISADVCLASAFPADMGTLRGYQAFVLANVPSDEFSAAKQELLISCVRSLGRGLLMTGGDASFALGGWRGQPLAEVLPVYMDAEAHLDQPGIAMMLLIDKSGSMSAAQGGVTSLTLACEAAIRTAELLTPKDQLGVIAFDDSPQWVVDLDLITDLDDTIDKIASIREGGGTMFADSLEIAYEKLNASDARVKHIILLTDGQPADMGAAGGGYNNIISKMTNAGITLSTVGIGQGASGGLLELMAAAGGGRSYACDQFSRIPAIFAKETTLASGSYIQNREFFPAVNPASVVTQGFEGFPMLSGYISTSKKELAEMPLSSDTNEPILSHWQAGVGRAAVFTSDLSGAWSGDWLAWENSTQFMGRLMGYLIPSGETAGGLEADLSGGEGVLRLSGEAEEAVVLSPSGEEVRVALKPAEPGVVEGAFSADEPGLYVARVTTPDGDVETGLSVPYTNEYDLRQGNGSNVLEEIARRTGGRVLTSPNEVFAAQDALARSRTELGPTLLTLAMLCFLLDVASRRLPVQQTVQNALGQVKMPSRAGARPTKPAVTKPSEAPSTAQLLAERKKSHQRYD